jgi:hypothetical protein
MRRNPWKIALVLGLAIAGIAVASGGTQEPPLNERVKRSIERGVAFLKGQQKDDNWEHVSPAITGNQGGVTALVLLALLHAGTPATDPAVKAGLKYLESVKSEATYVVALQTMVFCKADAAAYRAAIAEKIEWFKRTVRRKDGELGCAWGYGMFEHPSVDNSNTHFAVEALHVAAQANHKIGPEMWKEIQDRWINNQLASGGWSYPTKNVGAERVSMTAAGVACLAICAKHLPAEQIDANALKRGLTRLADTFTPERRPTAFRHYTWWGLVQAARLAGADRLKPTAGTEIACFEEVAKQILIRQSETGSWASSEALDGNPAIATSFAILALTNPPG